MKLTLNGKQKEIDGDINTLSDLVKKYSLNPQNIVIERNNEIINPAEFEKLKLKINDRINIFSFVGGG